MNILSAHQIKEWDQYTIRHEPVSSLDLMERAAAKCVEWILLFQKEKKVFRIFCGKGNNGGDGLAIARMLIQNGSTVSIYILETGHKGSKDFQDNLVRLNELTTSIHFLQSTDHFPLINTDDILIDALFGTGLNKPLSGLASELVEHINHSRSPVISIDMPSGLFSDRTSKGDPAIEADHTLTFQCLKKGLLVQENGKHTGQVHILNIGLHPQYLDTIDNNCFYVIDRIAKAIYKPRNLFSHKGNFGHALLIAGSYGKMGAAVLAARSCIRSGVGLLSCYIPSAGYEIMQTSVPEAMVIADENEKMLTQLPGGIDQYSTIGMGPGIGTSDQTQKLIAFVIRRFQKPVVIDADGLNCLAAQKDLLSTLPHHSILTPHPKEFDRLFGEQSDDFERMAVAQQKAIDLQVIIVLKSHHSFIALPTGHVFFNSTGNPGMSKGGSGDVLTGIITSLLAQKYEPDQAAILGVFIHGLAGDFAAHLFSKEAMTPTDTIDCLSQAFLQLIES